MAFITTTSRPVSTSFFAGLTAAFTERLASWRAYSATRDELSMLSDRDLADLGISRHDIRAIARESAYGA